MLESEVRVLRTTHVCADCDLSTGHPCAKCIQVQDLEALSFMDKRVSPFVFQLVAEGRLDILHALIDKGMNVNRLNFSQVDYHPLIHCAIQNGCVDIVELLIQSGAVVSEDTIEYTKMKILEIKTCLCPIPHFATCDHCGMIEKYDKILTLVEQKGLRRGKSSRV